MQTGTIRVLPGGTDTAAVLRQARDNSVTATVQRPFLDAPGPTGNRRSLPRRREAGFFFSGLGPGFAADGDALLLQFLAEDLDLSLIEIENPFAKDLLAYVGASASECRAPADERVLEAINKQYVAKGSIFTFDIRRPVQCSRC